MVSRDTRLSYGGKYEYWYIQYWEVWILDYPMVVSINTGIYNIGKYGC